MIRRVSYGFEYESGKAAYQECTEYNADFSELYCLAQALSAVMSILPEGNRNNHMTSREKNDMIKAVRNYEVNENE